MKKKKKLLVDFLLSLNNRYMGAYPPDLADSVAKSFLKERRRLKRAKDMALMKARIEELEAKLAGMGWRTGALINIIDNKYSHGFEINQTVIAINKHGLFDDMAGWTCCSISTKKQLWWVAEIEGEVIG